MNAQSIADAINEKVAKVGINGRPNLSLSEKYRYWTIGITNDLDGRKEWHRNAGKNVDYWRGWPADTEGVARAVEKYFLDLGMNGGGGSTNPSRVYIF